MSEIKHVLKFGGTSVGSADRIRQVGKLITGPPRKIVVLSAMSGTTDQLVSCSQAFYDEDEATVRKIIQNLRSTYQQVVQELFTEKETKQKAVDYIDFHFTEMESFLGKTFTRHMENITLSKGELISTALMHYHLEEQGIRSVLFPALSFMRVDKDLEPDYFYIRENLQRELAEYPDDTLFITQGYICLNVEGQIDNLERGGSDYTASLIGASLPAEEIQIWTDIDGIHNNDPRYVSYTERIDSLTFNEAAELAYFGAKILHPTSIRPAQEKGIPVRLKNTLQPDSPGTLITNRPVGEGIKAIAAKDCITAIRIRSDRMLLAHGFLRRVFEVFEKHRTPIDLITTSEVSVSVTIDRTDHLKQIVEELNHFGTVDVSKDRSIICVVGDLVGGRAGEASQVFEALKTIPVRMISYGSSRHNISLLVESSDKTEALQLLSDHLFPES